MMAIAENLFLNKQLFQIEGQSIALRLHCLQLGLSSANSVRFILLDSIFISGIEVAKYKSEFWSSGNKD